jgi:hypothetical protein
MKKFFLVLLVGLAGYWCLTAPLAVIKIMIGLFVSLLLAIATGKLLKHNQIYYPEN